MTAELSHCCYSPVSVRGDVTKHYFCLKCETACDTVPEVDGAMLERVLRSRLHAFYPTGACSMCGYRIGFNVCRGDVVLDTGCDCVTYKGLRNSSFKEMIDLYESMNTQYKFEVLKQWGLL